MNTSQKFRGDNRLLLGIILGVITFFVPVLIMTYYAVIGGWILKYMTIYIFGSGKDAVADNCFTNFISSHSSVWFGIIFSYYGIFLWLPTLVYQQGFTVVKTFEYILLMTLAQLPGYYCAAMLVDWLGRRYTLAIFLLGSGIASYFFGHAETEMILLMWGALMSFFNLGAWGVLYTYTPELYPTRIRGLGSGWAAGIGRIGGIIAPLLVGTLLSYKISVDSIFFMFATVFVIIAIVVVLLGIEKKNTSLEE